MLGEMAGRDHGVGGEPGRWLSCSFLGWAPVLPLPLFIAEAGQLLQLISSLLLYRGWRRGRKGIQVHPPQHFRYICVLNDRLCCRVK